MLEELLTREESKTLEFKENTQSLAKIINTIIAFANTAGGILVVGVKDKTKEVIGLENALQDEEKIASAIFDSVSPLLMATIHLYTWRDRDVLIVTVSHSFGPYYLKSVGVEKGSYIRLGSTNRPADSDTITEISRLRQNKHFDEQLNNNCPTSEIDMGLAKTLFQAKSKNFTDRTTQTLGLIVQHHEKKFPSNGAVLLFGKNHTEYFPDAIVRLGRFLGADKTTILDHQDLKLPISIALESILAFIGRHTSMAAQIGAMYRKNIPQYSPLVVREAVVNALLHTDYSITGAVITIAIFDDRIEVTNPGTLPFGLSLESAILGVSLLRNRVIGHVFRELDLIEQWGSGLGRMIKICLHENIQAPKFEEVGNFFRATIYHAPHKAITTKVWQETLIKYLHTNKEISSKQAQKLWKVTARTATTRLKEMIKIRLLVEIATSTYDPHKSFCLVQSSYRNLKD